MTIIDKNILSHLLEGTYIRNEAPLPNWASFVQGKLLEGSTVPSIAINTQFVVADESYLTRLITGSLPSQPGVEAMNNLMGLTTPINFVIGAVQAQDAYKNLVVSKKIGDAKGVLLSKVNLATRTSLALGGGAYLPNRVLGIISSIQHLPTTSLIGRITSAFGQAGLAFFSCFYFILAVMKGIQTVHNSQLRAKLDAIKEIKDKSRFLMKRLTVDREELVQKFLDKKATKKYGKKFNELEVDEQKVVGDLIDQELIKEAKEELNQLCRSVAKEFGEKSLSKKEVAKFITDSISKEDLIAIGLELRVKNKGLKKEVKMSRLISPEMVAILKKHLDYPEKIEELIPQIEQDLKAEFKKNIWVIILLVISTIALFPLFFTIGGTVGLIITIVSTLVVILSQFYLDGDGLRKDYANPKANSTDKKMILFTTAVCILSLATAATLLALGIPTFGIVPLISMLIMSTIWLGLNGYSWYKIKKSEGKELDRETWIREMEKAHEHYAEELKRQEIYAFMNQYFQNQDFLKKSS
ncbi:MAG: hypothetical protein L0207_06180 [Chlamydiae bacterium]|nr:hypothetical protein [Chlamydiota bacterium]